MEEESDISLQVLGDCTPAVRSQERFQSLFLIKKRVLLLTPDLAFLASIPTFQERLPPGGRGIPREICLDGGNIQD